MKIAIVLTVLALAAGCAAPVMVPAPGTGYYGDSAGMALIEGPSVPPPANDIPESQRRAWFDAQRPNVEPVQVERVIVREREPARRVYVRDYDRCNDWYLPLSLSLGWWGSHHRGHGWGWGLGWNNGWCW